MASDTLYTARFRGPDLLEQGLATQTVRCAVWRDGALVAPSTGTVVIYDADRATVASATVTVSASMATYAIAAATLAGRARAEGWRIVWTLTLDGVVHVFENDAALVRTRLYPVITDADLFRRVSALDPSNASAITSLTDYQDYLDEAWTQIQLDLIARGNRPNLIAQPSSLRGVHLALTLALVFEDLASRLNPAYTETARNYRSEYREAWRGLSFEYAIDDDGADAGRKRRSAHPVVMLVGR